MNTEQRYEGNAIDFILFIIILVSGGFILGWTSRGTTPERDISYTHGIPETSQTIPTFVGDNPCPPEKKGYFQLGIDDIVGHKCYEAPLEVLVKYLPMKDVTVSTSTDENCVRIFDKVILCPTKVNTKE